MTRSLLNLLETTKLLEERKVDLVSLRENIDTSAAAGRASAKARGKSGGRPRTDATKLENARVLYEKTEKTASEVCDIFGVGRRTFFAYLAEQRNVNQAS
jgi:DNA invertase Pin-like site-specific DNA recombinase